MSEQEIKLDKNLNLKETFPPSTYDEWRSVVERDLKGVPFEKKLITKTFEGIDLQPIYTAADLEANRTHAGYPGFVPFTRGSRASGYVREPWFVCQELPYGLAEDFNDALLYDLQRGMNCAYLPLDMPSKLGMDADYAKPGEVGRSGVSISALNSFSRTFKDVDLMKTPLFIDAGFSGLPMLVILKAYCDRNGIDFNKISGACASDPLAFLAETGQLPVDLKTAFDEMYFTTDWVKHNGGALRTIGVSGLPYHNAGASAVQELAAALATAVEYLNRLTDRGLKAADICKRFRFTFGVGSFHFMEIAKLRAARLLWSQIAESFSADPAQCPMFIHAVTSTYNMTVYDPHVNALRAATEAFSAVIGGADSLCVLPYDSVFSLPDEFSRRLARNTQTILNEEANLSELIDPAGGSYFIESLTESVAKNAWELFRSIEKRGGMAAALINGSFCEEVRKTAVLKQLDVNKRKTVLVGTNLYANPKEEPVRRRTPDYELIYAKRKDYLQKYRVSGNDKTNAAVLEKLQQIANIHSEEIIRLGTEAILAGATLGEITKSLRSQAGSPVTITPLESKRAAVLFEKLRDASDNYKNRTGEKPKVFLAAMGPLAQFKGRADFSKSFFEVGGFDVIYPSGFDVPDDAVKAALDSKAKTIVICSTDDTYPELVPPIVRGMKAKSPDCVVVLAGYPKEQVEQHKQTGVDEFIYLGADAVAVLSSIQNKSGVQS